MNSAEQIRQAAEALASRFEPGGVHELEALVSGAAEAVTGNRPAEAVLKMMASVCAYLGARHQDVHPDTLPVLEGLAGDLGRLLAVPPPMPAERREILRQSHQSFKSLKAAIAAPAPHLSEAEMEELKAVILSVDWEISDNTLKSFDSVITRLKTRLRSNKIHFTLLKLMHSIGVYVARNKAFAHKDSINLLRSVFGDYEKIYLNPDMPAEEKKEMVESDIQAYNAFRREIRQPLQSGEGLPLKDEDMPPALSHLKPTVPDRDAAPLSTLAEPSGDAPSVPAGKVTDPAKPDTTSPRDVMGDLFSPKASPADELLDAIHLAELHGSGAGQEMLDGSKADQTQRGIRNFTPERRDATPIPEIESRLDEFFNLDVAGARNEGAPIHGEGIAEEDVLPGDAPEPVHDPELPEEPLPEDGIETIVPFQYEDESVPEDEQRGKPAGDIMARMQAVLETPADLTKSSVFEKVSDDLSQLKGVWQDDAEKAALVDLLAGLSRYVHDLEPNGSDTEAGEPEDTRPSGSEAAEPGQPPPKGLWAKIKSIFR